MRASQSNNSSDSNSNGNAWRRRSIEGSARIGPDGDGDDETAEQQPAQFSQQAFKSQVAGRALLQFLRIVSLDAVDAALPPTRMEAAQSAQWMADACQRRSQSVGRRADSRQQIVSPGLLFRPGLHSVCVRVCVCVSAARRAKHRLHFAGCAT